MTHVQAGLSSGDSRRRALQPAWRRALTLVLAWSIAFVGLTVLIPSPANAATAAAWPASWTPYTLASGAPVKDVKGDENPPTSDLNSGLPCAGTPCVGPLPSVFYTNDGTNAFFRMRMSADNNDASKGGLTASAFLVQLADASGVVKAVVGVNGKEGATGDYVYVADSVGGVVNRIYTYPFTGAAAGMRWEQDGATGEYFLDFQVPMSSITSISASAPGGAITPTTPVKIYYGSSQAANLATINKDFMIAGDTAVSFANVSTVKLDPPEVTFDSTGGSAVATQILTSTNTATQPTAPTRSGYVFDGWWTAASGGAQWNFSTPITTDTTLFARWKQQFTVTFDAQGGSAVTPQTVTDGGTATQPTAPTRSGHVFDGWWTAASGGTQWNFATDAVTSPTTLFARWSQNTYTVSFDTHGGSAAPADQTIAHGELVAQPAAPTRSGYVFDGWWTAASGGSRWTFVSDTVTSATTLHAQWKQQFAVTFESQGGSAVSSQTVTDGGTATQPDAPARTGYTFGGWWTAATGGTVWDFDTDTVTAATVLYARWALDSLAQAITFAQPSSGQIGETFSPAPTASSGLAVTVTSQTPSVCTVAGDGTVTLVAAGTCTLDADQAGNGTWAAAPTVSRSFTVSPVPLVAQTITFAAPSILLSGAGPVPLTATATSELPVTLTLVSGDCGLTGAALSAPDDTTCRVRASQAGDEHWLPAESVVVQIQFVRPVDDTVSMGSPITGPKLIVVPVLANDPAGLVLTAAGAPSHGSASLGDASVTYTPVEQFHGVDDFSYQVSDVLGRTADAMVRIDVANTDPTVTGDKIKQLAGERAVVRITADDPNDDPISLSVKPDRGVQASVDGRRVRITPDERVSGWVAVTVRAADGFGGVDTAQIRSLVTPLPVRSATRRLDDSGTVVSWPRARTRDARYKVLVNGESACTTTQTQCTLRRILGPDFKVEVQVLGLDGTASTRTLAEARGHHQVLLRTVYFESGISTLDRAQTRKLATVVRLIRRLGFRDVRVSGYTDSDGGAAYNLALSRDRTQMVADYLFGAERISSEQAWFGYDDPVASNGSASGRALNRRVEILVSY